MINTLRNWFGRVLMTWVVLYPLLLAGAHLIWPFNVCLVIVAPTAGNILLARNGNAGGDTSPGPPAYLFAKRAWYDI